MRRSDSLIVVLLVVGSACAPAPGATVPTATVPTATVPAVPTESTPVANVAPPPPAAVARSGKPRKAQCAPEPRIADRLEKSACAKQVKPMASMTPSGALALGACEERAGHLVEALVAYEGGNEFGMLHNASLEQHASAVTPRIPQIRFQVHGAAPTVLWIDDDPVAIGTLSTSYGVNPGKHHVVASGPEGKFEETFAIVEGNVHITEVTLGEAPQDWPRWVPHDDLECRLDKMMTYPQARETNDCEAEKAAALRTNTTAEALALGFCYERAKLYPLACSAFIEAQLRNPAKHVQTMQHRYDLTYVAQPGGRPTKESLARILELLDHRSRVCPRGW